MASILACGATTCFSFLAPLLHAHAQVPASLTALPHLAPLRIPTPGNAAAYIGDYAGPGGVARMETFRKVVGVPNVSYSAGQFDWSVFRVGDGWLVSQTPPIVVAPEGTLIATLSPRPCPSPPGPLPPFLAC
jgi:hypothetical protein